MLSDEEIRRMIEEVEALRRQLRNLKSKLKRRAKKLGMTFDPLKKARIEFEIELLKGKILGLEISEVKLRLPLIKGIVDERKAIDRIDWSKAGKA